MQHEPPKVENQVSLQLLVYLDTLISERHVSRAAERVGIGQSAMSNALSRLRKIFNDPLLVRTATGMQPTERALRLSCQVQEALALLHQAGQDMVVFDPATAKHHFRILASEMVAVHFMPGIMARIRREAPGVNVSVRSVDVRRILEFLRDGEGDFLIGCVPDAPGQLHQTQLYPQQVVCITSAHHPEIQGAITLEQFVRYPHVVWATGPVSHPTVEALVDDALAQRNLTRTAGLRVPLALLSTDVVATTDMLAVVSDRIARHAVSRGLPIQILPLPLPPIDAGLSLLWHHRTHHDEALRWMRGIVRDEAAALVISDSTIIK